METAIKWSPNCTLEEQRFLFADVSGRSLSLGQIKRYNPSTKPALHYEFASAYRKVPAFRALDWASFDENLVAVGTPSGETSVLRLDDSEPPVCFPAKHQRLCNAVAFGRTGRLATGLERMRNDFCLNIWDVNQSPAVRSPMTGPGKTFVEPSRKFASSEGISSIKFFLTQPETLIVGVKGLGIRIYDLRESTGNPSLQFQTICVHNIAVDPFAENYFACAGPQKDTTIQIWDCRYGSPYSASSLGTSFGPNLGLRSEQITQHGPVLTYEDVFNTGKANTRSVSSQATVWSLRYCKGKGGFLGALASNGDFRVFETQQEYVPSEDWQQILAHHTSPLDTVEKNHEPINRIFTRRTHQVERAFDENPRTLSEKERIVSFDFTNLAGSRGTPCAIVLRGNQSIDIHELNGLPSALSFSVSGKVAVTRLNNHKTRGGDDISGETFLQNTVYFAHDRSVDCYSVMLPLQLRKFEPLEQGGINSNGTVMSSREAHEHKSGILDGTHKLDPEDALSLGTIARQRCAMGYLFDCEKNIDIVDNDRWLQDMWGWIQRAKGNTADKGMTWGPLDLSYLGVYKLWNQDLGLQDDSQRSSNARAKFSNLISKLAHQLDLPRLTTVDTGSPAHRQLCLYTCGLGLKPQQLDDTVERLIHEGKQTKAAALAIIHDQFKSAASALKGTNVSSIHRELSLAIAGFIKGNKDEMWGETVQGLALGLKDPYARAILALVRNGNWRDVLAETSLPLRDRVGIALMYLPDDELSQYINTTFVEVINSGDIEGIVLTGLTNHSVPLFETYIRKYSDLQTAVLALSHTSPRYFTDPRVTLWRETYRSYMKKWRMHVQRAQFDLQITKLSKPLTGQPTLPPAPRQITLRCNYCEQPFDRNVLNVPALKDSNSNFGIHQGSIFGDAKAGTLCPKCGRHMPRCVVCLHWLGMPDGHGRSGIAGAANVSKDESIKNYVSFCHTCHHMSHAKHAKEWFATRMTCPVDGCDCSCDGIDSGVR